MQLKIYYLIAMTNHTSKGGGWLRASISKISCSLKQTPLLTAI